MNNLAAHSQVLTSLTYIACSQYMPDMRPKPTVTAHLPRRDAYM